MQESCAKQSRTSENGPAHPFTKENFLESLLV